MSIASQNGYDEKEVTKEDLEWVTEMLLEEIQYLHEKWGWLEDEIYQHKKGHLPKAKSAEQLQRAIDALGLSAEYEVGKDTLWV